MMGPAISEKSKDYSTQPDPPPPPPSLLYEFATDTTCHGVSRVAKANTTSKRVAWILALIGAFVIVAAMIGLRVKAYLEFNSFLEINKLFTTQLQFPAITFCSFNKIRKSYSTGEKAKAMDFLNDLMANQVYGNESTEICTTCTDSQFKCLQDVEKCCIPMSWRCDGYTDCMDSSDETNCTKYDNPLPPADNAVSICDEVTYSGSETEGLIKSPGFGLALYDNNLDCQISVPHQGRSYILVDIWGEIEEGSNCAYDRLKIGQVQLCGMLERMVAVDVNSLSDGNVVNFVFQSDYTVNKDGFLLHWSLSDTTDGREVLNSSSVSSNSISTTQGSSYYENYYGSGYASTYTELQNTTIQMVDICDVSGQTLSVNESLIILSHSQYMSGENYPENLDCQVSITGINLEMRLHEIGVNGTFPYCSTDRLNISVNGAYGNVYCGFNATNFTPVSDAETIYISFSTNGDGDTGVGFSFIIRGLQTGNESNYNYYANNSTDGTARRRKRYLTPVNLYEVTRQRRLKRSANITAKTSTEANIDLAETKFSEIILEGGWQLEDNVMSTNSSERTYGTLLHCSYRGVKCSTQWFQHEYSQFGNCYTFNAESLLNGELVKPLEVPLMQVQPGPVHGLSIVLDVQRHEYSEKFETGNAQLGLVFQVHPPGENPDVENKGLAIGTGQHAYVGFIIKQNLNLEPPWGVCDKSLSLKYSDQYSFHQCAIECKLEYVVNNCGCKPFFYPGPAPECSAAELKSCAYPAISQIDTQFADECFCPVGCNYTDVDMRMSYAEFGASDTIRAEMNEKFYGLDNGTYPRNDTNFYEKNTVSLNIYYEELSETIYKQIKAMDESSLLSDLGGQLGLFVGVSVLTVCELIETILLGCFNCMRKRRQTRAVQAWEKVTNEIKQHPA